LRIAVAAGRASKLKNQSYIKGEADCIKGRGYVGAVGSQALNEANHIVDFHLTYDQISSASVSGAYWLIIIAGSSQYTVRVSNAQALASQIQAYKMQNAK